MKPVKLFLICFVLLNAGLVKSQTFEVPKSYEFKSADDYTNYEEDVIAAANWLIATPLNEQPKKRKEVSAFIFQWVSGSPTVNVEINETIMEFDKKNAGMLALYMACSAKYVLEHDYSKDMRAKHKAALREMIKVYKSGKGIEKDKKMDKLVKSDESGKIDEWLEINLKIGG